MTAADDYKSHTMTDAGRGSDGSRAVVFCCNVRATRKLWELKAGKLSDYKVRTSHLGTERLPLCNTGKTIHGDRDTERDGDRDTERDGDTETETRRQGHEDRDTETGTRRQGHGDRV
jgi:hypothetical protein